MQLAHLASVALLAAFALATSHARAVDVVTEIPVAVAPNIAVTPDIVVAADGSGDFKTIQAAIESIPDDNRERTIILVKNGTYHEKLRIEADCVTLRGESRDGVRIEYTQLADDFNRNRDRLGRAVINLDGDDFVMQNLTVENTANVVGLHAFTVYGAPDRTVVTDCNVLSTGADTMSLWNGGEGRYYHARCHMRGAVDFLCPRGWCYVEDCTFDGTKPSALMWHDGSKNRDEKFVLRNCKFDGVPGFELARHHHDAAFYFLSCEFGKNMNNRAPYRVIYPLGSAPATEEDTRRNKELEATNRWGDRVYFHDCHRPAGDYAWHADNLATAIASESEPGRPRPEQTRRTRPRLTPEDITPAWTFAGTWDPVAIAGPRVVNVMQLNDTAVLKFSEPVTVKGKPTLRLIGDQPAAYQTGSGTDTLTFQLLPNSKSHLAGALDFSAGFVIASQASDRFRAAETSVPARATAEGATP
jgi:pectinesterase